MNGNALEAVDFCLAIFPNAKKLSGMPGLAGKPLTITFELEGLRFRALNGAPQFRFNESISFVDTCHDQAEIDHYWSRLTADRDVESQRGWLKEKHGPSWQIVPENLSGLLKHSKSIEAP